MGCEILCSVLSILWARDQKTIVCQGTREKKKKLIPNAYNFYVNCYNNVLYILDL